MNNIITHLEEALILQRLRSVFEVPQAEVLTELIEVSLRHAREEWATRQDVAELRQSIAELTAAVGRLAEAQKRTEQRVDRLEIIIQELAEAQKRTDMAVRELSEAQKRTDAQVARLTRAVERLQKQVGGLSETVGGDIEDIAYIVIHRVLKEELGWKVGELKRTWQRWNGRAREIDLFGEAYDPAHPERKIWIVGEAKHNLSMRAVERFARTVEMARQHLEGDIFPVCFCYRIRPEVEERVQQLGFNLVFSYGKLIRPSSAAGE